LATVQGAIKGKAVIIIVFVIDTGTQERASTIPCGTTSELLSSDKYFRKSLRATVHELV
jgi:hypothetical protein